MTTTGKHVPAPKALSAGVIDAIEEDCVTAAKAKARELAAAGTWTVVAELPNPTAPEGYFEAARAQIEKKARGQMSPILGLQAVQAAVDLAFDEGMKRERALFIDGMASDQSRGLIHAFFGEREVVMHAFTFALPQKLMLRPVFAPVPPSTTATVVSAS